MQWKKVSESQQRFWTHHYYVQSLNALINSCSLNCNLSLNKKNLPFLKNKQNLIVLTKKSLDDEFKIVQADKDFSYASTCWLPVKSYYLIFNQLLTIDYILSTDIRSFNCGHKKCIENFTNKLSNNKIQYSDCSILNTVYDKNIFLHHDISGANLSKKISDERRFPLIMNKIADYKMEDWKRGVAKINSFRTNKNKEIRNKFLDNFKISIFEFPYYMRIRANYRDFAFIDDVSVEQTASYFNSYYEFTLGFYTRLKELEAKLLKMRMG